jgi:lysophospholipase L1-like esterase
MKFIYIIFLIIIVYSLVAFIKFRYTLSKANLPEILQEDKILGQGPNLRYIASGDSTAVGIGASNVQNTYTHQIAEELSKTNTVSYKNIGVSGAKTTDLLNNQISEIINFNPDIITISIGANDVTHLLNNDGIYERFNKIINQLTQNTKAVIYITNIPIIDRAPLIPSPIRKLLNVKARSLNPKLLALETERVKFINIHEFGWDEYPDIKITFAQDQFHPSDEGYNNWTKAFLSRINSK